MALRTSVKVAREVELMLPAMPNFIQTADARTLSVADLSLAELEAIGKAWAQALIEHAGKKRRGRSE